MILHRHRVRFFVIGSREFIPDDSVITFDELLNYLDVASSMYIVCATFAEYRSCVYARSRYDQFAFAIVATNREGRRQREPVLQKYITCGRGRARVVMFGYTVT